MKFNKTIKVLSLAAFLAITIPSQSFAFKATTTIAPSDSLADAKLAEHIVKRVTEIQDMDLQNLSATEKKALRNELKQLKKQGDGLDKKVYLSVGAIIIIILLLILILR